MYVVTMAYCKWSGGWSDALLSCRINGQITNYLLEVITNRSFNNSGT